ncbi:hypothetical protein NEIMUCOT_04765 [Neisseria mucosa ATCC 25996]|uniref:Uncharacterized protein n=1 Tax=Neisseria mucosa (strain ATCC 25996 / DSM 4631 / NCTC 10774 / M26) TaxID=546266 RepID=D2ZVX2_NEIM2|nr:hypothetical protein NEIMUCOT_04765 [Neisseria mucosa ATCC 25996]
MIINLVNIKIKYKATKFLIFRRPIATNQRKRMIRCESREGLLIRFSFGCLIEK